MNDIPKDAPACFGAASVFSYDSDICKSCCAFGECSGASLATLEAIKGIINVTDLLKHHHANMKKALVKQEAADKKAAAEAPPGNHERPVPVRPVERKTAVVPVKFELSPDDDAVVMKISNAKAKEVAYRMIKAGDIEGIRQALREKRNYYAERGPSHLRVGLGLLLQGGFTKRTLREAFEKELGWTDAGTISSHVGQACALFTAFKIAQEKASTFALVPESAK